MPDFKVAVRTAINLLTGPFLLSGTSSVLDDEGGNGSRRRVSPDVLARLIAAARVRARSVPVSVRDDQDDDAVALRMMGML